MHEYGLLRLVKFIVIQMAHSVFFLLSTIPTSAKILKEHSEFNLAEIERLKKMLNKKEMALVEWVMEVDQWVKKEANTQDKLRTANELLLWKD